MADDFFCIFFSCSELAALRGFPVFLGKVLA